MRPWRTWSSFLVQRYGGPVRTISVDTGLGCPNRAADGSGGCLFCDGAGARAAHLRPEEEGLGRCEANVLHDRVPLAGQIGRGLSYSRRRYGPSLHILHFQAWSNTNASPDALKAIWDEALSVHPFCAISVEARPDQLGPEVVDLLSSYARPGFDVWVEIGLQSASDDVLSFLRRGHDSKCFLPAAEALHERGMLVSAHMLLAPCLEGRDGQLATVELLNRAGVDAVKIHNLLPLGGTALTELMRSGACLPLPSVRRHVVEVARILAHLRPEAAVQRIMAEATPQRMAMRRHFPDKTILSGMIGEEMGARGWEQGCLAR